MPHKLLLAGLLALSGVAMQAGAQSVNGRVTSSTTALGIPGVRVEVFRAGDKTGEATTGANGEFHLANVAAGIYRACLQAQGYISTEGRCPSRTFEVSSEKAAQVEFTMTPMGVITVRVVDASGKPVPKARVLVSGAASGALSLIGNPAAGSGQFRIQPPLSGPWLISATAPASLPPPESPQDGKLVWVRTFYPRAASRDLAAPLSTTPGTEIAIEIKLLAAEPRRIRGVVLDPAGEPVLKAGVTLAERDVGPSIPQRLATQADGSFEFSSLTARDFVLSAVAEKDGVKLWTNHPLRIEDRDPDIVRLQLTAPFPVRGKIVTEPPWDGPATKLPIVRVDLANAGHAVFAAPPVESGWVSPDDEGVFTLDTVYPGAYTIGVSNPPPGYYLDSIRLGALDASGEVPISSGAIPIAVTLKQHGGTLRGLVENCVACEIWLASVEPGLRRRGFMRTAYGAANGHYEIDDVRPGEYYVFATSSEPSFELPVLDQNLINQSARVSVHGGETAQTNLRVSVR